MNLKELMKNAITLKEGRERTCLYEKGSEKILIKIHPGTEENRRKLLYEERVLNFLSQKNFPSPFLIDIQEQDNSLFTLYTYIPGVNGFHTKRNRENFYNSGRLTGLFHKYMAEFQTQESASSTCLIHRDLHSGNIVVSYRLFF